MSNLRLPETANINNEIESESEDEIEFGVRAYKPKHQILSSKKGMYCVIFIIIFIMVVAASMAITIIFLLKNGTMQAEDEQESFDTLQRLMEDESFGNNSDDNYKYFDSAFKTFDANNDGYLNQTEFSNYFVMQLNYSNTFKVMDVNKDNILSYPEVVTYEQKLNEIAAIKQNTLTTMVNEVKGKYGFEYSTENTAEFGTFLEFVVILEYFETFDTDKNGYITHKEFLTIAAQQEFETYDLDGNGEISHDDFFDILFGNDETSWNGKLRDIFGDQYQQTMDKVGAIHITPDMVQNVQINVSPIQTLRNKYHQQRRRLCTSKYTCSYTYDYGCRCSRYTCTWTCY